MRYSVGLAAIGGLFLHGIVAAQAQSQTAEPSGAKCEYFNAKSNEIGPAADCTIGPAGVALDTANFRIDGKPSGGPGALRRIAIDIKSRQGQWARVDINGKAGTRFETDRCNYAYASDDLQEFLTVKTCLPAAKEPPRPDFMTAGGAWVGKWTDASQNLCKGEPGQTEGLLVYSTKVVIGLENRCEVKRLKQVGPGVELSMTCYGEGMKSDEREILNVVNGKLVRTVVIDGKTRSFSYELCKR
jgi:hypothetical protein